MTGVSTPINMMLNHHNIQQLKLHWSKIPHSAAARYPTESPTLVQIRPEYSTIGHWTGTSAGDFTWSEEKASDRGRGGSSVTTDEGLLRAGNPNQYRKSYRFRSCEKKNRCRR